MIVSRRTTVATNSGIAVVQPNVPITDPSTLQALQRGGTALIDEEAHHASDYIVEKSFVGLLASGPKGFKKGAHVEPVLGKYLKDAGHPLREPLNVLLEKARLEALEQTPEPEEKPVVRRTRKGQHGALSA